MSLKEKVITTLLEEKKTPNLKGWVKIESTGSVLYVLPKPGQKPGTKGTLAQDSIRFTKMGSQVQVKRLGEKAVLV